MSYLNNQFDIGFLHQTVVFHFIQPVSSNVPVSNTPYYLFRTNDIPDNVDYSYLADYPYKIKNYNELCTALANLSTYNNTVNLNRLKDYYRMDYSYAFNNIIDFMLNNEKIWKLINALLKIGVEIILEL